MFAEPVEVIVVAMALAVLAAGVTVAARKAARPRPRR
jgi:hypothetical protein